MCCRYYIEPQDTMLAQLGDVAEHTELRKRMLEPLAKPLRTFGEIHPGDIAPVIATSKRGNKACFPMLWGFNSRNRSLLANARSETANQKPLFQMAWKSHRCIVPASWYYEWEHYLRPNGKKETSLSSNFYGTIILFHDIQTLERRCGHSASAEIIIAPMVHSRRLHFRHPTLPNG